MPGCPALYWSSACVGFSVQQDGGSGLQAETVDLIAELAFDQWRNVDCGGAGPGVVIQNLGLVECSSAEYNKAAGNANAILFNDSWPDPEDGRYAITTMTFDPDTGEIYSADIELNSLVHDFTVSDEAIEADLLSILTHETGHFLGIGHSEDAEATMYAFYTDGTTELRSLTADDVNAVCTIYPPNDALDEGCNPLPRHGFSSQCRADQAEGSCTISSVERSGTGRFPWAIALLATAALGGRATARSARRSRSRSR